MATGGLENYPSYNNRYNRRSSSSSDVETGAQKTRRLSSISEAMEQELYFGRLSFSEPKSPVSMNSKYLTRMTSAESHHSDDVFIDMVQPNLTTHNSTKVIIDKTTSTSSTASILPNPYNKINHKFHSFFWCTCCFYFVFFCCMPAIRFMEMSDKEYRRGNDNMARKHGRTSSACYILGFILTVVIYACILFLIIYFTKYFTS